jgi:hypothetical protein
MIKWGIFLIWTELHQDFGQLVSGKEGEWENIGPMQEMLEISLLICVIN